MTIRGLLEDEASLRGKPGFDCCSTDTDSGAEGGVGSGAVVSGDAAVVGHTISSGSVVVVVTDGSVNTGSTVVVVDVDVEVVSSLSTSATVVVDVLVVVVLVDVDVATVVVVVVVLVDVVVLVVVLLVVVVSAVVRRNNSALRVHRPARVTTPRAT